MENPATWGPAEKIMHQILNQPPPPRGTAGLSVARQITDALRHAGLLADDGAENAAAFAAVEAIRAGKWDRHLKALLIAVNERRTRAHAQ